MLCYRSPASYDIFHVEPQEYIGKAGDVLDDVFFVVKGRVEARLSKPGKQVGAINYFSSPV